ncbi:hypothetical protein M3Y99_01519400 [Aphelenchoides fujianensis]|nr:hypothetical protein M3Y99_01519400 [Aphelenchoides fujianensis]
MRLAVRFALLSLVVFFLLPSARPAAAFQWNVLHGGLKAKIEKAIKERQEAAGSSATPKPDERASEYETKVKYQDSLVTTCLEGQSVDSVWYERLHDIVLRHACFHVMREEEEEGDVTLTKGVYFAQQSNAHVPPWAVLLCDRIFTYTDPQPMTTGCLCAITVLDQRRTSGCCCLPNAFPVAANELEVGVEEKSEGAHK